jgi:hypothetical protein
MKKTIITASLAFAAGAACAGGVIAFGYKETLQPEEFLERSTVLLSEVAQIGAHVAGTRDGRTFLREAPPIACIPPPNPKLPVGAVPIGQLKAGIAALIALNQGLIDGEPQLATVVGKCHIVGD